MTIIEKLYDYNTELDNDTRAEIAAHVETLLQELDAAANTMRGMAFDLSIHKDARTALIDRANQIDSKTIKQT